MVRFHGSPLMSSTDILEAWKGEVQKMQRDHEATQARERQNARRATRSARDAFDASEGYRQTQDTVQRLTERLAQARGSLEKMHVPGCLRVGYGCPACDALEDLG